jgi:hypothetical protein
VDKRLLVLIIFIFIGQLFLGVKISNLFSNKNISSFFTSLDMDHYKEAWGFDLHEPTELESVWSYQTRDYVENFNIYSYKDDEDIVEQMDSVDETSLEVVNRSIEGLESQIFSVHSNETLADVERSFNKHHVRAEVNDYYVYKEKDQGSDITMLLYKANDRELYLFEIQGVIKQHRAKKESLY